MTQNVASVISEDLDPGFLIAYLMTTALGVSDLSQHLTSPPLGDLKLFSYSGDYLASLGRA